MVKEVKLVDRPLQTSTKNEVEAKDSQEDEFPGITNQPTQRTDMRAHREITLPITSCGYDEFLICFGYRVLRCAKLL